jgi:hypothetical protein
MGNATFLAKHKLSTKKWVQKSWKPRCEETHRAGHHGATMSWDQEPNIHGGVSIYAEKHVEQDQYASGTL